MEGGGVSNVTATKGLVSPVTALILLLIVLGYRLTRSIEGKHEEVMRTVTDGLHGEGTYDTIRAPSAWINASPNVVNVNLREFIGGITGTGGRGV